MYLQNYQRLDHCLPQEVLTFPDEFIYAHEAVGESV